VERHLVWSCYEIFDREKSRDWFHPPFIGESMVCSGYKGLNCSVSVLLEIWTDSRHEPSWSCQCCKNLESDLMCIFWGWWGFLYIVP
jgi:hypothetical protein